MSIQYSESLTTAELASVANREEEKREDVRGERPQESAVRAEENRLLPDNVSGDFRSRWDGIQAGFVDEPRAAVQRADELVAQAMKKLAETFADERKNLEQQWDRGDNVSTEDLRVALQKYRSFFHRLLSM